MHAHPPNSPSLMAARSVQPFLPMLHCATPFPQNEIPLAVGIWNPNSNSRFFGPADHHPKRNLDRVGRFSTIHARYGRTDRATDRTTTELDFYEKADYCDAA